MESSRKLEVYRTLLQEWTKKVNLIGPEAMRNLDEHIAEALEAARILDPAGEVLDVGSGGGLPAIPMAVVSPAARFHLVEADSRKWAFLKHVLRELELNAVAYGARLESLLPAFPAEMQFSLVTSRAVGKEERWVPLLHDRLAPGGRVALFEGHERAAVPGFRVAATHSLSRGEANTLTILELFHVEQSHG